MDGTILTSVIRCPGCGFAKEETMPTDACLIRYECTQCGAVREALRELCVTAVSRAAASVLQFLKIGDAAIEITGCWTNLYAPAAAHHAHSHPNNYLSAVYYVRTWSGAETINFHDPRGQVGVI